MNIQWQTYFIIGKVKTSPLMKFVILVWPCPQIVLRTLPTHNTFQQVADVRQQYETHIPKKMFFFLFLISFTYNQRIPLMLVLDLMHFQNLLAIEIQFSTSPVLSMTLIQTSICLGFGVVVIVENLLQLIEKKLSKLISIESLQQKRLLFFVAGVYLVRYSENQLSENFFGLGLINIFCIMKFHFR